ncbi:MAG: TolC family protein [Bacteroidetes bacterium]|jgi:outer membrane protein|nr:TolC family protein [Bacteroidota bacterium]MBT5527737.1 TolC family protein [Cytophagia bacterium]MBT3424829.1 TolC family protein [Bacteroidota bacterium]MBT3801581.1 TolC family protein [Bacteroidota bacterium]MBT3934122.1 TolC family protein [Bacteroidota bacterium]
MNRILIILLLVPYGFTVNAQDSIINMYIDSALSNNLALQQKEYSYKKSLEVINEAKRLFLPTISFNASYTIAEGGRMVEIPFGDMMNPVYNNLNQINQVLNPSAPKYPEIENMEMSFVRSPEQETKLVATMPVFNAAIIQNHKIKKGLAEVEGISVDIYKRELVKEVKEAYVKYLQAEQAHKLYINTLSVVNQNLKNREILFANDKITIDEVYTAKAQVKQIELDLAAANKNRIMASSWFNFLLNRDFDAEIETVQLAVSVSSNDNLEDVLNASLSNREEFTQFDKYVEIQENNIKLEKGAALPNVTLFGQYGFQGTDYSFNDETDMAVAGLSMKWNLFTSGQRKSKIQQAQIDRQILESRKLEAENQVQLEVINTYYSLQAAKEGIELAKQELENYQKSYSFVEKKYQQGIVNYLEYSNSLNNKLNAENKLILAQYSYQLEQIKLERLTSSYQF